MSGTLVTTAEQELRSILDWAMVEDRSVEQITGEITRRLNAIELSHDGWRSRCLIAEKKNREYLVELQSVREQLRDLKYGECAIAGN
jgi:hypothetical protein